jgi:cobalt-zinc-cadmium efflux system membrane fusion protein
MGIYDIRAPFAGTVVQKHITAGERVTDESEIFTIADLSSVWINLTIHAKDLTAVQPGTRIQIRSTMDNATNTGTIAMVTPFLDDTTRTGTARVMLDNTEGNWKPGTFVSAEAINESDAYPIVIPKEAVQRLDGEYVVFIREGNRFETSPVVLGPADASHVAITSGVASGTEVVTKGAFHLKATLITRNLDPHAGHGH